MNISYLKEDALKRLKINAKNNLENYKRDVPWLKDYFGEKEFSLPSRIKSDEFKLVNSVKGKQHYDLENTRLLYGALKDLTIEQATEERLWAYLAHDTFWEYMRSRWNVESRDEEGKIEDFIEGRYFFMGNRDRALIRNGISRLWWFGYTTYDESYDDPFMLTKILLRTQDAVQSIMERSFSRNPLITKSILKVLYERENSGKDFPNRDKFRGLVKDLNRVGGIAILDSLEEDDIRKIINKSLAS